MELSIGCWQEQTTTWGRVENIRIYLQQVMMCFSWETKPQLEVWENKEQLGQLLVGQHGWSEGTLWIQNKTKDNIAQVGRIRSQWAFKFPHLCVCVCVSNCGFQNWTQSSLYRNSSQCILRSHSLFSADPVESYWSYSHRNIKSVFAYIATKPSLSWSCS